MLLGTVKHETWNIIEETVSTYNIFKGGILDEVKKRHRMRSGFREIRQPKDTFL